MRYREDFRTLLFLTAFFSYQLAVFFHWRGLSVPGCFVPFFLNVFFIVITTLINHNHQHLPIFVFPAGNRAVNILISTIMLAPGSRLHAVHLFNHHQQLRGEDWSSYKLVPDHLRGIRRALVYLTRSSLLMARKRGGLLLPQQLKRELVIERAWVLMYSLALAVYSPGLFFLFVLPSSICGLLILLLLNLANHDRCQLESERDHSRNFLSPLENWLTFNNGFHVAHHARPGLHWSLYPAMVETSKSRFDERSALIFLLKNYLL